MVKSPIPTQIPAVVRPLLDHYLTALDQHLPGLVEGCYLHGSIALGAFLPGQSDIDFVSVTSRPCTDNDISVLRQIHQQLANAFPQWPFEGSYLQWHHLGQFTDIIEPGPVFANNQFQPCARHDINSVTWWVLKNRGVALIGPAPKTLDFLVDWDLLLVNMRENLNTYWGRFTREPGRIVTLFTDDGIQWTVLGVLRQFYTFQAQDITSKAGAGDYALQHVPERWHRLIEEALNIRNQTSVSLYRSKVIRAIQAFYFLKFIIHHCNQTCIGYTHHK